MRKLWLLIGALAGLALAACGAGTAVPLAPTAQATSTLALLPSPIGATPTLALLPTSVPVTCTVSSRLPTPGPTEISLFPGVSQTDWKQGPDGARVVIIEYSDYQ